MRILISIVSLSLLLGACSGGGEEGTQVRQPAQPTGPGPSQEITATCLPAGGGEAVTTALCINCVKGAIGSKENAVDGNLDTYATIDFFHPNDGASQASQASIKVTAQPGTVFPAGSKAGAIVQFPVGTTPIFSATATTYMGGVQQESTLGLSSVHIASGDGDITYVGFDDTTSTSLQFDSVELSITEVFPSAEEHLFKVYELCGDGALSAP